MKSPLAIAASALVVAAVIGWSGACAGDLETETSPSQGTSMSGASNTNPSGSADDPSEESSEPADCSSMSFDGLAQSCTAMCDALSGRGINAFEYYVPSIEAPTLVNLYAFLPDDSAGFTTLCNDDCNGFSAQLGACYTEYQALLSCLQGNGRATPPDGPLVYLEHPVCEPEGQAIYDCALGCGLVPQCDPSICNGTMSAGGVFCSYQCQNGVCTQSCN
jgi:hypothetical protein